LPRQPDFDVVRSHAVEFVNHHSLHRLLEKTVRRPGAFLEIIAILCLMLMLAGCGDSVPLPPGASNDAGGSLKATYTPSIGAFTAFTAASSQPTAVVTTCSLDAVNDQPAGSAPVSHASTATFTGWVADSGSGAVPSKVQLVLRGVQSYVVTAATGMSRPDVAKADGRPAWVSSGYSVKADLSAVPSGTYKPVLQFDVKGKYLQCPSPHPVVVQ
jgi:hypothetical protein